MDCSCTAPAHSRKVEIDREQLQLSSFDLREIKDIVQDGQQRIRGCWRRDKCPAPTAIRTPMNAIMDMTGSAAY
jgi:hypothetical protein